MCRSENCGIHKTSTEDIVAALVQGKVIAGVIPLPSKTYLRTSGRLAIMADINEARQLQQDARQDDRDIIGPRAEAVIRQFPLAAQPEVMRAAEKDDHYASYVYDACHDAFRHVFGTRFAVAYQNETKLAGQMLYYLLTTGSGLQTLGEEYCDLTQVARSSGVPPTPARRILLVFLQTTLPYIAERLSARVATRGVLLINQQYDELHNSFGVGRGISQSGSDITGYSSLSLSNRGSSAIRWSRFSETVKNIWLAAVQKWPLILPSVREASQLVVRANLMFFYFEGLYYHIAKRAAGIHYVFIGKPLHQRPRYQILGIFLLIQLCIVGADWLRQSNLSSLTNIMRTRSLGNELTAADGWFEQVPTMSQSSATSYCYALWPCILLELCCRMVQREARMSSLSLSCITF